MPVSLEMLRNHFILGIGYWEESSVSTIVISPLLVLFSLPLTVTCLCLTTPEPKWEELTNNILN